MEIVTFGATFEVLAISSSIRSAATNIQAMADDWLTLTEEYESKVDTLQQKLDFYDQQMNKHGMKVNSRIMVKKLQRAERLLKVEEERVRRLDDGIKSGQCCGVVWWVYAKITMIAFPQKLEKTIKRVTDEIDNITAHLKMEVEMSDYFKKLGDQKPMDTTVLDNDDLYVPIEETQKEVIAAIEDSTCPSIILLHGGVGKGKSTLARKMCEYFEKSGPKGDVFQHVILVPCGNRTVTNPSMKQFEILKRLSPNSLYQSMEGNKTSKKLGEENQNRRTQQEEETNSSARITQALKDFLSDKKVLVILDDVSDRNFLMKLWQAAPGGRKASPSDETKLREIWEIGEGDRHGDPSHQEVFSKVFDQLCKVNVSGFKAFEKIWKTALDGEVVNINFFKRMWEVTQGNQHVKYLVTSQQSDLCENLRDYSLAIWMRDPTLAEAMQILASLVGWKDKIIQEDLQGLAIKMIESVDKNPLALACLASSIRCPEKDLAWYEVCEALHSNLLDNVKSTKTVLGEDYATPPVAAMRLSIDSLTTADAKIILFLAYACKAESVSEEVLRILYSSTKSSSPLFSNSLEELRTRELLKPNPNALSPKINFNGKQESWAWSLRSLVKLCMAHDMPQSENSQTSAGLDWKEVRSRMSALFGGDESGDLEQSSDGAYNNKRVAITLCSLYFDRAHSDELVKKLATQGHLRDSNEGIDDLRRRAIEPIIWLLAQPKRHTWTEAHVCCTRQVFLKYVCEQKLDDDSICVLLNVENYDLAPYVTVTAIANIFEIEVVALLDQGPLRFLEILVHFLESSISSTSRRRKGKAILGLDEGTQVGFQSAASKAIAFVCWKACIEDVVSRVAETPGILRVLVDTIQHTLGPPANEEDPRAYAVWALGLLASGGDSIRSQILEEGGTLPILVQFLSQDSHPKLQEIAAVALGNLGGGQDSNKFRVLEEHWALTGLVKSISQDKNPGLQAYAGWALETLAQGDESIKSQIVEEDGALSCLIKSLSQDTNLDLQVSASTALAVLAGGPESIKSKISEEDGAISALVKALSNDNNPDMQVSASAALAILAEGQESTKSKILEEHDTLHALVKALSHDNNHELQAYAGSALANLAKDASIKYKILQEDSALAGLVKALSQDNNPALQVSASEALAILAEHQDSMKSKILEVHGALSALVKSLSHDSNHELQTNAGSALASLAMGQDSIKYNILEEDGALVGLVKALSQENNPDFQLSASVALTILAEGQDSIKSKILEEDGALSALVKALTRDSNPDLELSASAALATLAKGQDSIKFKILEEDGVLAGLFKALAHDNNPDLQVSASMALVHLANGEDSIKYKILEEDDALSALVKALCHDNNHDLQENAGLALGSLAMGPYLIKSKILDEGQALRGLVRSLSQDTNPRLQAIAAKALASLGEGQESIKSKILEEDGALSGLVKALPQENNPALQVFASMALVGLAQGDKSIKSKILKEDGAFSGLMTCLSQQNYPKLEDLQINAAWALWSLAEGDNSIRSKILEEEGVFAMWVKDLSHDHLPLKRYAAMALKSFTSTGEWSLKVKMIKHEGLMTSLTKLAAQQDDPVLQEAAMETLENLKGITEPYETSSSSICMASMNKLEGFM